MESKFIGKKKDFTQEKISTATELGFWDTNMAAVKLFWATTWWTLRHVKKVYMFIMPRKVNLFTK